jgi:hypothetical protein
MKLSNPITRTSSNQAEVRDDAWAIEVFGRPLPMAAGSIQVTEETWDRQIEWFDYPRWLLCRLHLIHRPHCHAYSGYGWVWREDPKDRHARESGRCMGIGCYPIYYWKPRDWWFWFVRDCNHCDHHDCLNYNDC